MSITVAPVHQFPVPKNTQLQHHLTPQIFVPRQRCRVIRCSNRRGGARARSEKDYYELLGVSVHSEEREIKEAYRKLQKRYHPDVAGQEGHECSIMLNEAYKVLMNEELRKEYDAFVGVTRLQFQRNGSGTGYSSWKGPLRPQALFVDENACIGCRECLHHASNTFVFDEGLGCARVKVQYGDDNDKIEVAVDSCPVNCIHWVDKQDLAVLEFLIQPQPKQGHGIFGQGWERPKNVFMVAKAFMKQLGQQPEDRLRYAWTAQEETPAQAQAQADAMKKFKKDRFLRLWNWIKQAFISNKWNNEGAAID